MNPSILADRTCKSCGSVKPAFDFYANRRCCKDCYLKAKNEWRAENSEKVRKTNKIWYEKNKKLHIEKSCLWQKMNPDKAKKARDKWSSLHPGKQNTCSKRWKKNNPDKVKLQRRNAYRRRMDTPVGNLNHRMCRLMNHSLRGIKNGRTWRSLVGYTSEDLRNHIERQFKKQPGMSWERFMAGEIHVDHIIPVSAFNYEKPEDVDFKRCWALKNLQPLWASDNVMKSNKVSKPFQPSLRMQV